jgi:hypothetical protein
MRSMDRPVFELCGILSVDTSLFGLTYATHYIPETNYFAKTTICQTGPQIAVAAGL